MEYPENTVVKTPLQCGFESVERFEIGIRHLLGSISRLFPLWMLAC